MKKKQAAWLAALPGAHYQCIDCGKVNAPCMAASHPPASMDFSAVPQPAPVSKPIISSMAHLYSFAPQPEDEYIDIEAQAEGGGTSSTSSGSTESSCLLVNPSVAGEISTPDSSHAHESTVGYQARGYNTIQPDRRIDSTMTHGYQNVVHDDSKEDMVVRKKKRSSKEKGMKGNGKNVVRPDLVDFEDDAQRSSKKATE